MKKTLFTIGLIFSFLCINAQEKWTLRQCIDYAIENNIQIKQQELQVKNSEINLSTSKNAILPNLNASAGYGFSFGQYTNTQTNANITTNASGLDMRVSSSMPLFTGFKITNQIKQNELELQATMEGLKKAKENLELQITSYFLEVLFKQEVLKVYEEQAQLTLKQVERTEQLVEAGKAALSQLYDIKAQLAKDELNITSAKNALDLSRLDLAQVLNLTESENFDIVSPSSVENDVLAENMGSILPPAQIYGTALMIKPHVREAELNVESRKKALNVARSDYYPTLDLSASYSTSSQRAYNAKNPSFSNQLRDNSREYIGVTLNIPIFNRFQTRNRVRAAKLDIMNQQLALDNVKLVLYKEIQQAHQSATAAQAKFISTEKAYEAAAESYKYAEERYKVGKMTVFELSEAQTKMLSSKSEQLQAKYDFLFRAKILDFYRGVEIDIR